MPLGKSKVSNMAKNIVIIFLSSVGAIFRSKYVVKGSSFEISLLTTTRFKLVKFWKSIQKFTNSSVRHKY